MAITRSPIGNLVHAVWVTRMTQKTMVARHRTSVISVSFSVSISESLSVSVSVLISVSATVSVVSVRRDAE